MSSTIKFEGTQKSKQWGMLSNEEINKVMDEYDQGQSADVQRGSDQS